MISDAMKGTAGAWGHLLDSNPEPHVQVRLAWMSLLIWIRRLSVADADSVSLHRRARFLPLIAAIACSSTSQLPTPERQPTLPAPNHDYARIEREILDGLNRARTDPRAAASDLDALTKYYDGQLFQRPTQSVPIRTVEGIGAAREAATAVRSQRALNALALSAGLTRAARDHALDQQRTGAVGHTGSDGSSVDARAGRYGAWLISLSENIDYSPVVHGGDVVQNLLIDDGVPDRGHRRNIYGQTAKVVGIACAPHPRYGSVCVLVQAGGFTEK